MAGLQEAAALSSTWNIHALSDLKLLHVLDWKQDKRHIPDNEITFLLPAHTS